MYLEKRYYIAPQTDVVWAEAENAVLASCGSTEGFDVNNGAWTVAP